MIKTIMRIDGMMCGNCEAHVNKAVEGNFSVKKVTSSHESGETVIISESALDETALKKTIENDGYTVLGITSEPYEKKGLFGRK